MTVGKSVFRWLGLTLLVTVLVLGCQGKDGPMGPPGFQGDQGDPGQNRVPIPIADQTFGILINNSTANDYQGALAVELTSDETASPSGSRVVAYQMDTPPMVDGIDGGTAEWGNVQAADIALSSVAGNDVGITSASIRVGYNLTDVYMQIKWTEVENSSFGFVVSADTTGKQWIASSATSWAQSGGEDVLRLLWEITPITGWSSEGAGAVFDGSTFVTAADGEIADMWVWGSTISYYGHHLQDRVVKDAAAGGAMDDVGGPYVWLNNRVSNRPHYMKTNSPLGGTRYPLRDFEYTTFNSSLKWRKNATIPGYVYFEPSRSAADILAVGRFANGTWTVELQRRRNTGQPDDVLF